jgi:rubrerythrin
LKGESQAKNKYTFFAEICERQKKPRTAALFRAAAQAEEIVSCCFFEIMLLNF